MTRIEQDLIEEIHLIESKMRYHIEKSSDVKDHITRELHLDMISFYELKKLGLIKLLITKSH